MYFLGCNYTMNEIREENIAKMSSEEFILVEPLVDQFNINRTTHEHDYSFPNVYPLVQEWVRNLMVIMPQ